MFRKLVIFWVITRNVFFRWKNWFFQASITIFLFKKLFLWTSIRIFFFLWKSDIFSRMLNLFSLKNWLSLCKYKIFFFGQKNFLGRNFFVWVRRVAKSSATPKNLVFDRNRMLLFFCFVLKLTNFEVTPIFYSI